MAVEAELDAEWRLWCLSTAEAAGTSEDEGSEGVVRHAAWAVAEALDAAEASGTSEDEGSEVVVRSAGWAAAEDWDAAEAAGSSEDEGGVGVVRHAAWEVETLMLYNELLYGCLQPEVDLGLEAVAACESTDGSDAESEGLGQYEMCMSEAEEVEELVQSAVSEDQGVSEEAAQGESSG